MNYPQNPFVRKKASFPISRPHWEKNSNDDDIVEEINECFKGLPEEKINHELRKLEKSFPEFKDDLTHIWNPRKRLLYLYQKLGQHG